MAASLRQMATRLCTLVIVQLLLVSLVHGLDNKTVDQPNYTNFELFKNSGFHACSVNASAAASIVARDPRGGGRGGGGGGGGGSSYTTGGGASKIPLILTKWVTGQASFCRYMTMTPIMIPTLPTAYSFLPWWPTYLMQFVSMSFSLLGLWWTARSINTSPLASEKKLPITFWVQLPIDLGRIGFWFVQVCMGFADAQRFSWFSLVLWLIPFNYFWLVRLIGTKPVYAPNRPVQRHEKFQMQQPGVVEYTGPEDTNKAVASRDLKILGASTVFALITLVQWCMSLAIAGTHFNYSWSNKAKHPTYFEVARAIETPSSIAQMPQACLKWLQSAPGIMPIKTLDVDHFPIIQTVIAALQFVACTALVALKHDGRHHMIGKVRASITAVFVSLALPALATGIWILVRTTLGEQNTLLTYSNDRNATGGCTFGMVNMNRKWGYWDVDYQRPTRIAMSVLGVA